MIFTTNAPQLPASRLSRPALLAVSVVHIALFWLLLQTAPVQRVVRETVVMLNLPITQPLPKPPPKKVITLPKPGEPIKPIEKPVVVTKTITSPVEPLPVPPPKPVEPPKPIEPPKPREPPKPVEPPKQVEKPVVLPKPPEKVVEVKPVEVVVPKEIPKELAKEAPKELPKETAKELPVANQDVAAPAPTAVEPARASVPAAASAPSAASVAATAVVPSASKSSGSITERNAMPNANASTASSAAPASSAASTSGGAGLNPLGSPNLGIPAAGGGTAYVPGRRGGWAAGELQRASSSQLNPNKRPENYEIEFEKAKKDDCLHPTNPSLRNGLRMLNGDCPK